MKTKLLKLLGSLFIVALAFSASSAVHATGVVSTITLGGAPWGVAYDPGRGEVFVVNSGTGIVSVISDSNDSILTSVTVGQAPYRDVYDPGRGEVFVADYGANSVSVISDETDAVVATVPVGTSPASFAYDSGRGEVFVANSGEGTVSVISDSNDTVVATVSVGSGPYDLAYDSAKGEVFVANALSRSVSVISDSNDTVVATIGVGSGPLGVAYDPARGEVFVADSVSDAVSVISDSDDTVVATIAAGATPRAVVYDSGQGEVFVLDKASASVSVVSDSTDAVVANVSVGTDPYGAAYDPARGEVFVANEGDGTVSVLSDSSATATASTSQTSATTTTAASSSVQTTASSSTQDLAQQVWVPAPTNAVAAVGASGAVVGVVSLIYAAVSNPLGGLGGSLAEKTKGVIPDNVRKWMEEVVSSKQEREAIEKAGSRFKPTRTEVVAYAVSIVVLAVSFSYVKVVTLDQMWALLPVFFTTGVLVGFVQKFFSTAYLRSNGVWSETALWPMGLLLFLFTTFAFRVPFSSPTQDAHSKKYTKRLGAIASSSEVLVGLAFAGLFFLLLKGGFPEVGGAGLSMCVIGSFFGVFPIAPMSGKDIFDHSKRLWAGLFLATSIVFVVWLLMV
ncbi:MAG: hypothetical protein ABSF83_06330 [Nitrososphaerales archaeon]